MTFRPLLTALALGVVLFLSACESDAEKAERYYQSALSLMAEGDIDRALIELRNVFLADGFHREARELYARTVLAQGNVAEAYSQYLLLIEQYPDALEARLALAETAMFRNDWPEAERHGTAALALAPDDPRSRAIAAALAYRAAVTGSDPAAQSEALQMARDVLEETPDSLMALRVLIDGTVGGRTPQAALPLIDRAIALAPDAIEFPVQRLRVLEDSGDTDAIEAQLETMFVAFPDAPEVSQVLIDWYLSQQDYDAAETLLRDLAEKDPDTTAGFATLVQFLQQARGPEAADAELDRLIAATDGTPANDVYRAMKAVLMFDAGDRTAAVTTLQDIVEGAEPSDDVRRIKIVLARMQETTGNRVGARALVEEVLAEDTTNVDALKIRATWQIAEDRPDAAINDLRAALSQSPRDPEILLLMAQAHARAGNPDLAGERLALAVEVSGAAPREALLYVDFLLGQGRASVAEGILLDARRADPTNLDILARLAELRLQSRNWVGAQDVISSLETINTQPALELAGRIRAAALLGQNRTEDGLALLQEQLAQSDDPVDAAATIVMAQIRTGKPGEARAFLDTALAETPDALVLRALDGSLRQIMDDPEGAEAVFRDLVADYPDAEAPARLLYGLLAGQGRPDEARAVLGTALQNQPESGALQWIEAGLLEREGDIDGAIAIYDALYARDSSDIVIANNLASMLATYRDDAESLERAFAIARRLRTVEAPAVQDTYGWIESRRGNPETALPFLEAAAEGLPNDPLVQYHLGMTYAALDRSEAAAIALTRALDIAGDSPLPQFDIARQTLAELPVPPTVASEAPDGTPDGTSADAPPGAAAADTPPATDP